MNEQLPIYIVLSQSTQITKFSSILRSSTWIKQLSVSYVIQKIKLILVKDILSILLLKEKIAEIFDIIKMLKNPKKLSNHKNVEHLDKDPAKEFG